MAVCRTAAWLACAAARLPAARRADAAVRTHRACRRSRHHRRRRVRVVRLGRPGFLQLHRLRALGAPRCCASTSRRRLKAGDHLSLLGEVRTRERRQRPRRTRSTCASGRGRTRDFDIQVGRVPPTFGAFARRTYATDNPLIGYPLAYQYLTSLRPTRCRRTPTNCCECADAAGSSSYLDRQSRLRTTACRSSARSAGTPACRCTRRTASSTPRRRSRAGTLSNPLFADDNGGRSSPAA